MCNSVFYKIASKLSKWLSIVPETQINCQTMKICKSEKVEMGPEDRLIYFDVSSLYTNVPWNEALSEAANILYLGKYANQEPSIRKDVFIQLGTLALNDVFMSTCDGYYIQKMGLAMGSPFSPSLANMWMTKFDDIFLKMSSPFYFRHVDDIIMTIHLGKIEETCVLVNTWHNKLKFTYELEDPNGSINFFTKQTSNGLTLNFHATAPAR